MTGPSRLARALLAALLAAWTAATPARAATVVIVNLDGPGEGFNDPTPATPIGGNPGVTLGVQRFIAFQHAANLWALALDSAVTIRVEASFDPLSCGTSSAVLGAAGAISVHRDFEGAPAPGTWYPVALASKLARTDLDPGGNDIGAQFNSVLGTSCAFPAGWYLGLDGNPAGNDFDFVTVLMHEIGHGLGFQTFVDLGSGAKLFGFDDVYMEHLEDHDTGLRYPEMTDAERVAASTSTGDLHWVGEATVSGSDVLAAGVHPSGHVEMYAPSPQRPGSSVSHFSNALFPSELMEPFYTGPTGEPGLARTLLTDIGWDIDVSCDVETDQTDYGVGETVTVTSYRLGNVGTVTTPVELKAWFRSPEGTTFSLTNLGADGSSVLPPVFDLELGPFDLFTIAAGFPQGVYTLGCRLMDPVTGRTRWLDVSTFEVQ